MSSKSLKPKTGHDSWYTHLLLIKKRKEKKGLAPVWIQSLLHSGAYSVQGILLGVMGTQRYMRGSLSSRSLLSRQRRQLSIISYKIRQKGNQLV